MSRLISFFSFVLLALAVLCSSADAYIYLSVTGKNVNIRAEAKLGTRVITQANYGEMFIAENNLLTNADDGSKWYKIIMTYGDAYVPLEKDERFGVGVAAAYISANFVHVIQVSKDEEKVISRILGKAATVSTDSTTIKVSNSREFLEALGSDRVIEMQPGRYNLSEWDPYLSNKGTLRLENGVSWTSVTDGGQLVLKGIKNLTILGSGAGNSDTAIVIDLRYALVLRFENCTDIVLRNLTAGDAAGNSMCSEGVLQFTDSSRISMTNVGMFGCGEGLKLYNASDVKVAESAIYKCTFQALIAANSRNVSFLNCMFRDNGGSIFYSIISVHGAKTDNISFSNCTFTGNSGKMFDVRDTTITVSNSTFTDNETDLGGGNEFPIRDSSNVKFTNCVFN